MGVLNFCKYNKRWTFQATVFISLCLYRFYTNVFHNGLAYSLARGFGAILKFPLIPAIVVPLSRVLYTEIRRSRLGIFFGLNQRLTDHKIYSIVTALFAIAHTFAHFINDPTNFIKQPGISGLIMIGSLAIPLAGVFLIRSVWKFTNYSNQIIRPHQVGAFVFLCAYAWHTLDLRLLPYSIVIFVIYFIDKILEKYWYTWETNVKEISIVKGTNFYNLVLEKPKSLKYQPGQYFLIYFPTIQNKFECAHPFTAIGGKNIQFLIKAVGKWTNKLSQFNNNYNHNCLPITISGPFGCTFYKNVKTFIVTGIGVTPIIPIINQLDSTVDLHVSQKRLVDFKIIQPYLKKSTIYNSYAYVTKENGTVDNFLKTVNKRPDFETIIRKTTGNIFVCGSPSVVKIVHKFASKFGKKCFSETQ